MNHPLLYEINTRSWLAELSERAGRRLTLAEIPDSEFAFWQRSGFTHIWLMGVWTLGARGRAVSRKVWRGTGDNRGGDIVGSPYAICSYTVARRFGGEAALAKLRRKLKELGLKLLLDFIPNHTAIDHPWVKTHPEFYVTSDVPRAATTKPYRGARKWFAYGDCGHGSPWMDTLQLEYRNPELRRAMTGELLAVAEKCDGVRCDMAMLMLNGVFERTWQEFPAPFSPAVNEFWREAICAVRERGRDFLFLGEAYWDLEARLQELGFDFTYGKRLYDRIIAHDPRGVTDYLKSLTPEFIARSAHFLENHDEPRIASLLPLAEHRAAALLILALPGLRLLHEGQMDGARTHASIHYERRVVEEADPLVLALYERLLSALQQTCVGKGKWELLQSREAWTGNPTHQNFVVTQWQGEPGAFDLAVVNLAPHAGQCFVALSAPELSATDWRLVDLLGDEIHERSGREMAERGLYLDLPAHGAQLFHCRETRRQRQPRPTCGEPPGSEVMRSLQFIRINLLAARPF